jgi:DAK2 domain fusion protein YloV
LAADRLPVLNADANLAGRPSPIHCDGVRFHQLMSSAVQLLALRANRINALNVFPVPDGDTGTNMLLTVRAALRSADELATSTVGAVAAALAHGALMGARGNSGVILSQYLLGLSRGLADHEIIDGAILANALGAASDTARAALQKPVEGTMLTVARDAATAARQAADEGANLLDVLDRAVVEAHASVARTTDLLPVLRQAGVVDSGALGLATMLEGMSLALRGEAIPTVDDVTVEAPAAMLLAPEVYGYCTEFLVRGVSQPVDEIRAQMQLFGDSLLVVGEPGLVRVHVHTFTPGLAIDRALGFGEVEQLKIENMQQQNRRLREGGSPSLHGTICGLVAVAAGVGFQELFRSLGATVVPGGQTLNPSAQELLHGAHLAGSAEYVVLANNPNVVLSAQQAIALGGRPATIVRSRNMAEGVAAALAFLPDLPAEKNAVAMERARRGVRTAEVTIAVRDAQVDGVSVSSGTVLGIVDEKVLVQASELIHGVLQSLAALEASTAEVISIYVGEGVSPADLDRVRERVQAVYPSQRVEILPGGQPHYPYILACE